MEAIHYPAMINKNSKMLIFMAIEIIMDVKIK
jgi:hypothetical protein